jgi:hypothetical protein
MIAAVRRLGWPDLAIAGAALVLAVAVVTNGFKTTHDIKRVKVDHRVGARWFGAHRELGRFGPPRIKVRGNPNLVCAARQLKGATGNPIDGYCIEIADTSIHSTRIVSTFRCFYPRAAKLGMPTRPPCLARH